MIYSNFGVFGEDCMAIDLLQVSSSLFDACANEPVMFLEWSPADPDSTTMVDFSVAVTLIGVGGYKSKFNLNKDNFVHVVSLIESVMNANNQTLLGYNFKNFCSLYKKISGRLFAVKRIYDLFWYESYLKIESSNGNLLNAVRNFKNWIKNKEIHGLYQKIYKTMIVEVLPSIESVKIVNDDLGKFVFSNYHVEGQENGRLSCSCNKKNTFNPHSLGEEKKNLQIYSIDIKKYILQYDFKNMEVGVLACLSKDKHLLDIVHAKDNNVYGKIFEAITGIANFEDSKNLGKKIFLPLIYGQAYNGLAKSLDISTDQAEIYYNNAVTKFPDAFGFVESAQSQAKNDGFLTDYFGRKRYFESAESYKGRNFIIQSPAALICIEALIKLYKQSSNLFSVVFHVHDGYFIVTEAKNLQDAHNLAKNVLESKTDLMPELQLRVSAQVGTCFEKMVPLNQKKER